MGLTVEEEKMFKENQQWLEFSSKCGHSYQQYEGIPSLLLTCKLINDACRFENCPIRIRGYKDENKG